MREAVFVNATPVMHEQFYLLRCQQVCLNSFIGVGFLCLNYLYENSL